MCVVVGVDDGAGREVGVMTFGGGEGGRDEDGESVSSALGWEVSMGVGSCSSGNGGDGAQEIDGKGLGRTIQPAPILQ